MLPGSFEITQGAKEKEFTLSEDKQGNWYQTL
jgi:hypothetical protein